MLDAYIIDAIRQEELERARREEEGRRIWLELPVPPRLPPRDQREQDEEEQRGPVVIPFGPDIEDDAA